MGFSLRLAAFREGIHGWGAQSPGPPPIGILGDKLRSQGLPIIRSHERIDYKRCTKKWYWKWRKGLVPKAAQFGALELGTWMHDALAQWYGPGLQRRGRLGGIFLA